MGASYTGLPRATVKQGNAFMSVAERQGMRGDQDTCHQGTAKQQPTWSSTSTVASHLWVFQKASIHNIKDSIDYTCNYQHRLFSKN